MQKPSVLTTRATRKTTPFWVRDAKSNAAGAMHRVAWALRKPKGTRKKCDIHREKQCFAAEDMGFERPTESKGIPSIDVPRDANYDARQDMGFERPTESKGIPSIDVPRDANYDARQFHGFETTRSTTQGFPATGPMHTHLQGHDADEPMQICRATDFRLRGHLQGHIKNA